MHTRLPLMVAICIVAIVALCAAPQSPTPPPTGVPVYSGSKEQSLASYYYSALGIPTEGVVVKVYFVEGATASKILDWYKKNMPGYEIVGEEVITRMSTPEGSVEWGAVMFKKGNEGVGIWALSGAPTKVDGKEGAIYCIVTGNIEKLTSGRGTTPTAKGLPSSDQVRGEEPIPRYPKSVMLYYSKSEGFPTIIIIDYGTMDNYQTVAEWYKRELVSKGWTVKDERRDAERATLHLVKAQEEVGVIVYAPTSEKGYTSISVHYGVYKLPSKDLARGSEPIQRYPGSVMLEHSSMTYMGVITVWIKYGTHDSVDNVASWYNSYLAQNGWQVMMTAEGEGAKSLTCVKGNAMISLTISPKAGYTEIGMTHQGEYKGS